jgi:protein O-mannosyl-transferase
MRTKSQKYYKPIKKPEQRSTKTITKIKPGYFFWLKYALLCGILIVTFWCYHYSLGNEFTNFDDERFITENMFIKAFTTTNLKMMLLHDVTGDYYNPLTIISYAVNYHFSGLAPESYYLINIIFHLMNTCLIFFLVLIMLKAMEKHGYGIFKWKEWLAFFCTMVFAIHPMHVDSVSWIAERKDVLYAFFYFAGMLAYIIYINRGEELEMKNYKSILFFLYLLVLSLFLLSLLSKPMAIVFPFSLLSIDVLLKRDKIVSLKNIFLEKLPFILISIISAIITYNLQKKLTGFIYENGSYTFSQRLLFACYSFYMYFIKAFIPIPQSLLYPYPELSSPSGNLPFIYYLSPIIALLVVSIPLYFSYRPSLLRGTSDGDKEKNNFRIILFGLGFYFFNMIIISQLIGVGPTIIANRYSYICYFGIFFPATCFIYNILSINKLAKKIIIPIISIYILFLTLVCHKRTFVWHNSETLWTDVIKQYPFRIGIAYNNLGNYYLENGELDKAYNNYQEAIKLQINDPEVYREMGLLMCDKKQYDSALNYYTIAIKIENNFATAYMDRGIVYAKEGRYALAINDYKRTASLNPYSEALLQNIAFTYLKAEQYDSSIAYYNRLIQINPAPKGYFLCRGVAKYYKGDIKPALEDLMQSLHMAPHDSTCMYYLSMSYNHIGDFDNAYKYAQMAKNSQYPVSEEYINSLKARLGIN